MNKVLLHISLAIVIIVPSILLHSQSLSWTPELPTANQSLSITFNPQNCNCPLAAYQGELYAHTGVIIGGNPTWQAVIGNWGQNDIQPKLQRISSTEFTFEVTPDIYSFYDLNGSESIDQLAMVIRSSDGSLQTADLFIPVFSEGQAEIVRPRSNSIFDQNEAVLVEAVILGADSISLFVNDQFIGIQKGSKLELEANRLFPGLNTIQVRTIIGGLAVTQEVEIFINQLDKIADVPDNEGRFGALDLGDTTRFILSAPGKKHVHLLGDFNNWTISDQSQMYKSEDGTQFWIDLLDLPTGKYAYQYIIDGQLQVADPYARSVLDSWNDGFISDDIYPNRLDYPEAGNGIVSVFEKGAELYNWRVNDFVKPDKEDLIIYELLVRDFVADHSYQSVIDSLDYLVGLGINALELMPVMEFEGNSSWGYNTSFHMALDKYYGTSNDFKRLVDACHEKGIAVILDLVINHAYGQSPMVRMYWDNQGGRPSSDSPWFNQESPNQVFSFGYDYNHESVYTKSYFKDVLAYWVKEYKIDGYRLDFTKGLTNIPGDGSHYDYGRVLKLRKFSEHVWEIDPDAYMIMEHFAPAREEREIAGFGMMLWGNHNHNFNQVAMGYSQESNYSGASYKTRGFDEPNLVAYMESHDEERMLFKTQAFGASSGNYNVKDLEVGLNRAKMASLLYYTIPGPKMIWQFGELGYDISIDDPCRVCEKPILWNYYQESARRSLKEHYADLASLRNTYSVFQTSDFDIDANGLVKMNRLTSGDTTVVVLANISTSNQTARFDAGEMETWFEYYSLKTQRASNREVIVELAPGAYALYSNVVLSNTIAEPGINSVTIQPTLALDKVVVEADGAMNAILAFNASGQSILEIKSPGNFYSIDVSNWVRGTYIIVVEDGSGDRVEKKIIKLP